MLNPNLSTPRRSWVAAVVALGAVFIAGFGCQGSCGNSPQANHNAIAAPLPFDEQVAGAVKQLVGTDAAAHEAGQAFFEAHANEALPVLLDWLRSDAGLTVGIESLLAEPADAGGIIALEFAATHHAPELYPALLKLAVDPTATTAQQEKATAILSQGGFAALDLIGAMLLHRPETERMLAPIIGQFPHGTVLRYWLQFVADDNPERRKLARNWVKGTANAKRRDDIRALFDALAASGPPSLATEFDPAREKKVAHRVEAQRFILRCIPTFRVWPGSDPWFVPMFCQTVVKLRDSGILPQLYTMVWTARRLGLITRLERWHAENPPLPGSEDAIGYAYLGTILSQLKMERDRFQGEFFPDAINQQDGGPLVPYGPDADAEFLTDPRTGEPFRADWRIDWATDPPANPGRPSKNDAAMLAQLGRHARENLGGQGIVEFMGEPNADPNAARYPAEWWPTFAARIFTQSPIVQAIVACGKNRAVPALQKLLGDTATIQSAGNGWRARIGAWLALGRLGAVGQAPLQVLDDSPATAWANYSDFEKLAVFAAMAMDADAFVWPVAEFATPFGKWMGEPFVPAVVPFSAVHIGRDVHALLAPAASWAISRQSAAATPDFWRLREISANETFTAADAAIVTALARHADGAEPLRQTLIAYMAALPAAHRAAMAAAILWQRHPWSLAALVAAIESARENPPVEWLDALLGFDRTATVETFAKFVDHPNVAVRRRAVAALPAVAPWTEMLETAMSDANADVAQAAAVRALAGPADLATRAAENLWADAPKTLLANLHRLSAEMAVRYIAMGLKTPALAEATVAGIAALMPAMGNPTLRDGVMAAALPCALDESWATSSVRAKLVDLAGRIDFAGAREMLHAVCRQSPWSSDAVVAAAKLLIARADRADLPALLQILTGDHRPAERRIVFRHIYEVPDLLREPGVVDAMLPYLKQKDDANLYIDASLGLVGILENPDPRIGPAICRAYFDGVLQPFAYQQAYFLSQNPSVEVAKVLLDVLLNERLMSTALAQQFLARHYFEIREIREMMRQAWFAPNPTLDRYVALATVFCRPQPPTCEDQSWLATVIQETTYDGLPDLDAGMKPGEMPPDIVRMLVELAGIAYPKSSATDLRTWLTQNFRTHDQWRQWWSNAKAAQLVAAAEADYNARLTAAENQRAGTGDGTGN